MFIIRHKTKFFILSALLGLFSLFSIFFFGLNVGIEFTGGTLIEITYTEERPTSEEIETAIEDDVGIGGPLVQPAGERGYIIRMQELTQEERQEVLTALSFDETHPFTEERYNLIGPAIGEELRTKAWIALGAVLIAIVLIVWYAFRKVSGSVLKHVVTNVKGWHYGAITILALVHDILIPTGIFAFLGTIIIDAQIDVLFVTALLAILGYSVNDTIVVFDRIRENLNRYQEAGVRHSFSDVIGESLNQTYVRSINTSLTTLIVLLFLFFIGGATTQSFALVLSIGVLAGTYSSLFLAAPLLAALHERQEKSSRT